jgi:ABC-type sugar transport system ATPase subunit
LIEILDIKRMKTQTEEALKNYGLNIDVDRKIKQLSGGQRRLVTILRAFLSKENTKLILLDEIYIGLSPGMLEDLSKFLNNFLREHNISAIFAAQWLEQLMGIADRILVLRRGRIVGIFEAYSVDSETIYRLAIG